MLYQAILNPYLQDTVRATIKDADGENMYLVFDKTSKLPKNFVVDGRNKAILEKLDIRLSVGMEDLIKKSGFDYKKILAPRCCGQSSKVIIVAKVFKFIEV